jgi:hypothetical protein
MVIKSLRIMISVLSTGLLLAGCTLEKIETVESTLLKASVHTDAFTKVDANIDYASGKVNFTWTGGDAIAVQTTRQGFSSFDLIGKGGGVSGIFTGVDDPVENAFAVFPSAAADCVAGNVLSLRLPSSYEYVEGQTNVLMYANVDAGNQLVFNHLASLFCIEVEEVPAGASFVISAPGKKLHGDFQVDCSEASPCVSLFSTSEEDNCTVSVDFAQGQDLAKIYVPLPVGEYPSLNVKMLDKDGNVLITAYGIPLPATYEYQGDTLTLYYSEEITQSGTLTFFGDDEFCWENTDSDGATYQDYYTRTK